MCVHVHECSHAYVCVYAGVHMCGSQRTATGRVPQVPFTLLLETGCLLGLEFAR